MSNYQAAKEQATAWRGENPEYITGAGLEALTFAVLALVDELRELGTSISCEAITEVVAEEVSSALIDVFKDHPTRIGGVA